MTAIVCPCCGAALDLILTAFSPQPTATDAANPPQVTANGAAKSPQVAALAAGVADVFDSKNLDLRSTNTSATGRKRYAYTDEDFLAFWDAYPLHREKAAAFAVWKRVVAAGISPQMVIAAAAKYAAYCDRNNVELRHRKYPSGWLNDGRWDDEYPEEKQDARYQPYDHEAHLLALEEIQ